MVSLNLGAVIAERQFEMRGANGDVVSVLVRVGQPVIDASGENWVCPYEIIGPGITKSFGMHGIDSMQALELTLRIIETEAAVIASNQDGSLRWLDAPYKSMFRPN